MLRVLSDRDERFGKLDDLGEIRTLARDAKARGWARDA